MKNIKKSLLLLFIISLFATFTSVPNIAEAKINHTKNFNEWWDFDDWEDCDDDDDDDYLDLDKILEEKCGSDEICRQEWLDKIFDFDFEISF